MTTGSISLPFSGCSIEPLLPTRRAPELTYLCAKNGASVAYREAARSVADLAGLPTLSHTTVRKDTVQCGEYVERTVPDRMASWPTKAQQRQPPADRDRWNGIEREPVSGSSQIRSHRRQGRARWPNGAKICVCFAASELDPGSCGWRARSSGWVPSIIFDVISDGARGMRSLVTSIAPRVSPRILDWFHVSMKLRAVPSSICAYNYFSKRPEIMQRSERLLGRVRDALWRGRGETAIEMLRTLAASLAIAAEELPFFYRLTSGIAYRVTIRLLTFLEHSRKDLVDYQRARMEERRVSSASAASVMNHLINRRLSRRQQMRWSMHGAHYLLQARVELLDGRLERCFRSRYPRFRSPETFRR